MQPTEFDPFELVDPKYRTLTRAAIADIQAQRLPVMLDFAYEHSGLIRQVWGAAGVSPAAIRSVAEFTERAPFISQDVIRNYRQEHGDPCGGLATQALHEAEAVASTSGTTGNPTPIIITRSISTALSESRHFAWSIGLQPGEFIASPSFTFRSSPNAARFAPIGAKVIAMDHSPADVPRLIQASLKYRPSLLYPLSAPLTIAIDHYAQQLGVDLREVFSSYRGTVFGGERVGAFVRERTDAWGLERFEICSAGDVAMAIDCKAHAGCHAWEDIMILECLEPNGTAAVADGQIGELVTTTLTEYGFPLIRYRTDDLITIDRRQCGCGSTHARIKTLGRKGDLVRVRDRQVLPNDVWAAVETLPETAAALFQIGRSAAVQDRLQLRVGYDPGKLTGSLDRLRDRVIDAVGAAVAVPVEAVLVEEGELLKLGPPHKIPRVFKV